MHINSSLINNLALKKNNTRKTSKTNKNPLRKKKNNKMLDCIYNINKIWQ
jgi:hypothetical protein